MCVVAMRDIIERIQGGSGDGLDTHKTTYFKKVIKEVRNIYQYHNELIVDPFARDCRIAHMTNDLNPNTKADYHMDALDFLKQIGNESTTLLIFDPPFSSSQSERYGYGNIYATPGVVPDLMTEIDRILVDRGLLLKFGYNTTRHKKSFQLLKTWVVNFGGNRNDVLVTLWRRHPRISNFWSEEE